MVWRDANVEMFVTQQTVHERKELKHELILSEIVAILDNDCVRRSVVIDAELEAPWKLSLIHI